MISTELTRILQAKSDIKEAIENKGVSVPDTAKLDGYADYIDQIEGGGGGGSSTLILPTEIGKDIVGKNIIMTWNDAEDEAHRKWVYYATGDYEIQYVNQTNSNDAFSFTISDDKKRLTIELNNTAPSKNNECAGEIQITYKLKNGTTNKKCNIPYAYAGYLPTEWMVQLWLVPQSNTTKSYICTKTSNISLFCGTSTSDVSNITIDDEPYNRADLIGFDFGKWKTSSTQIPNFFLSQCLSLNCEIKIPDYVTSVGSYFLYYCISMNSPIDMNNVTSVGASFLLYLTAFNSTLNLKNIKSYGTYNMQCFRALSKLVLPPNFKFTGNSLTELCNLRDIYAYCSAPTSSVASSVMTYYASAVKSASCVPTLNIHVESGKASSWQSVFGSDKTSSPFRKIRIIQDAPPYTDE